MVPANLSMIPTAKGDGDHFHGDPLNVLNPSAKTEIDVDTPMAEKSHGSLSSTTPTKRAASAILSCGTKVNLLDLDLPYDLHEFLVDLDFDSTGDIEKEELDGFRDLLQTIHKHLDGHDKEEIHKGIAQLGVLMQQKMDNADEIDYTHMPERVQKVLKKWDAEKTGRVTCNMLQRAAIAEEHMAKQNAAMKKVICALGLMCLVLLSAIFPLVFMANEAAKEMHVEGGGQMRSTDGSVVSVASSDFEVNAQGKMVIKGGGTGRRLSQGTCDGTGNGTCASSALQTAAASEGITDFASTLPDETFQEMKSLTLTVGEAVEAFPISSFRRVQVRSSKCGSLVYLEVSGGHGHFILDDTTLSVDDTLAVYLEDFPFTLEEHQGMGRRLAKTDGMLKGFFNMIAGMEQTCSSQPLEAPDVIGDAFNFKAVVEQIHSGDPQATMSQWFFDGKGRPFPMPGYRVTYGTDGTLNASYRTWSEFSVQAGELQAYLETSTLQPYTKALRIKDSRGEVAVTLSESGAFDCIVRELSEEDAEEDPSDEMKLTFVGLKTEGHLILRHFRLFMLEAAIHKDERRRQRRLAAGQSEEENQVNGTEYLRLLIRNGEMPEYFDYFDIDSDNTGVREAGSPYRLVHDSSVQPNTCYRSKQFEDISPVEHNVTIASLLNRFGVKFLSKDCRHLVNESSWTPESLALKEEFVRNLPINTSLYSPKFRPDSERRSSILYSYEKLLADTIANPSFVDDLRARDPVWDFVLRQDPENYLAYLKGEEQSDSSDNSSNASYSAERRLSIEYSTEKVLSIHEAPGIHAISERNKSLSRATARRLGVEERRLGAEGRRLGTKVRLQRYYSGEGTFVTYFELDFGDAQVGIQVNTDADNKITYIHGEAYGCAPIYTPPTIKVCFGGGILWQPPAIGGFISCGAEVGISVFSLGLRLNLYAAMNYWTKRLAWVGAEVEVSAGGKLFFYGSIFAEPSGCGRYYYNQWDFTVYFRAKYTGRPRWFRFDKTWTVLSFEVGHSPRCR
jgi:hypothetical protein